MPLSQGYVPTLRKVDALDVNVSVAFLVVDGNQQGAIDSYVRTVARWWENAVAGNLGEAFAIFAISV